MKKLIMILVAAALPLMSFGQDYVISESDLEYDFGARVGATVDKKLTKGLHLELFTEGRLTDNFSSFSRVDARLGVSYKINDIFKVSAGYMLIEKLSSSNNWKTRHRVFTDASVTLHAGDWRFSVKERLQLTHKDVNTIKHQTTPNSLTLKSRAKVWYKGYTHLTPYGYVEVRNVFNDPSCTATWSNASEAFGNYQFLGYDHAYVNRIRCCIGAEWAFDRHNSLDFYLLNDYCKDKEIDTYAEGTKLRSLYYNRTFNTAICVGYKFSF
jgi:hypothetical protein